MPPSVCRPGLLLASLFLLIPAVPLLHAHGTMANPKSRVLRVYEDLTDGGPNHPATEAAIGHRGSDAYFTWNQVARFITPYDGAGASPYTRSIPDGQLASAANGTGLDFSGLDLVGDGWDWPAEEVSPGPIDLTWYATATHNPSSFKVFLTNTNYSHKTPLAWDQMEFLGEVTHTQSGSYYHFTVNLPERTGRHVLYVVWQRIDPAGEAFFAAVDLNFSGRGSGPSGLPVVGASDVTVEESAGVAAVSVTLSGSVAAGGTATVDYRTTPISATPDSDYTRTSGTLTFLPNQLEKTISVAIADDAVAEVREAFRVVLSNPKGLQLRTGTATISIADNDAGNSGGYSFEKRNDWGHGYDGWLHLSNPGPEVWDRPTLAFTLPPGADFSYFDSRFSGDIDTDGNVTVTGLGTLLPGETLSIDMVVNPAPGANDGPADLRIDGGALDAFPPDVSIADVERPEGDASGQSVTLFVQLDAAHPESVHVSYATVDDTATAGKDYTATSGSLEFIPGETRKTISVPFNGNAISEGDKVFLVVLGAVPGRPLPELKEGGSQAI
ncbi:MAG: lytic polysaccharide monooxygenase, partial [Verrucomicrobiota bacterium]